MPINHSSIEDARSAKEAFKRAFGATDGLVGVGLTRKDNGYAVKVNMQGKAGSSLPAQMAGVPLVVEVVGAIQAQTSPQAKAKAKAAPAAKAGRAKR